MSCQDFCRNHVGYLVGYRDGYVVGYGVGGGVGVRVGDGSGIVCWSLCWRFCVIAMFVKIPPSHLTHANDSYNCGKYATPVLNFNRRRMVCIKHTRLSGN